ncbi:hypothetical protein BV898_11381 [Hypsibius exemplaris]|uniref:Uncharacterized protein n=1 Tax=Hypsibius exemplaris TaxID=2072580 RepID=A0A1W0WGS8_HYPEX|nr:hypothetical protein BV898_11381 [Hypsibius exemplaris]
MEDVEKSLTQFDQLGMSIQDAFSVISLKNASELTLAEVRQLDGLLKELKPLTISAHFPTILTARSEAMLALLICCLRHRPPSLLSRKYPELVQTALRDVVKRNTDGLIAIAVGNADFARACLEMQIQFPEEAFPLSILLCLAISITIKRGGPKNTGWWFVIDSHGELQLVKAMLRCVQSLLPEICQPMKLKSNGASVDLYTFILRGTCSIIPLLDETEMNACAAALCVGLRSTTPLVAMFTADTLKFISKISSSTFTLHLLLDCLDAVIVRHQTGKGQPLIIQRTACRLVEELSPQDKLFLAESLPVRRHFFLWSGLPPRVFLEHSDVLLDMYTEAIETVREAVAGCPRSDVALGCLLCRLPLSLQCLCNFASLEEKERAALPALKDFTKDIPGIFLKLWKLLNAVPQKNQLNLVRASTCLLLRLGVIVQHLLTDSHLLTLLQDFNRTAVDCAWIVPFAAKFLGSLGKRRRLGDHLVSLIHIFFSTWCVCSDALLKNAAMSAFFEYASWTRCGSAVAEYRNITPDVVQHFQRYRGPTFTSATDSTDLLVAFQGRLHRGAQDVHPMPLESADDAPKMETNETDLLKMETSDTHPSKMETDYDCPPEMESSGQSMPNVNAKDWSKVQTGQKILLAMETSDKTMPTLESQAEISSAPVNFNINFP